MYSDQYLIPEWRSAPKRAIREGISDGLLKIGSDERVAVLTGNLAESTRVKAFRELYPERFFDVGVAEQNLAGVAAGMSFAGMTPFITSFATFSPGRNWEQTRVSIALSKANVKIIGSHAGVATGENGPSHQATEDVALMRVLPNMTVLVPADATQMASAVEEAYHHIGPVYIRACRPQTPDFTKSIPFEISKAYVYREGKDITICASGIQVWDALVIADELSKEGVECEVVNVSSIKPLDAETILSSVRKTRRVVTFEDHQIEGGMGSAITEILSERCPVPIKRLGVSDRFGISAPWEEIYTDMGLDKTTLKQAVIDWLHPPSF